MVFVTPRARPAVLICTLGRTLTAFFIGLGGGDGVWRLSLRSTPIDRAGELNTRFLQRFRFGSSPRHRIFRAAAGESSDPSEQKQMAISADIPVRNVKQYSFAANPSAFAWGGACAGPYFRPSMFAFSIFFIPFSRCLPLPFGITIDSISKQFRCLLPRSAIEAPIVSPALTHPFPPLPQRQAHLLPAIKCSATTRAAAAAARTPRRAGIQMLMCLVSFCGE